jgi:hypothetical protein
VELRELARLVQVATELERDIVGAAISVKDIFDFFDEDVIRERLADRSKRRFPGHAEARAAIADAKWKTEYREKYGIDVLDVQMFAIAGAEMRRRGLRVPELGQLLGVSSFVT